MLNEGVNGSLCPYTGGNINSCFNYLQTNDVVNMYHCFDYYLSRCVPYIPSDSCQSVPADTISSGGMEFSPAVVDSVMTVFNLGFKSGLLTYILPVAGAIAILAVIHLLSYAISKI